MPIDMAIEVPKASPPALPTVRCKHIEPIIDILPHSDAIKQESLLRTIFSVLFKADDSLVDIPHAEESAAGRGRSGRTACWLGKPQ